MTHIFRDVISRMNTTKLDIYNISAIETEEYMVMQDELMVLWNTAQCGEPS